MKIPVTIFAPVLVPAAGARLLCGRYDVTADDGRANKVRAKLPQHPDARRTRIRNLGCVLLDYGGPCFDKPLPCTFVAPERTGP